MEKVLFITSVQLFGDSFGGQQRSLLFYQALTSKYNVDVLLIKEGANTTAIKSQLKGIDVEANYTHNLLRFDRYKESPSLTLKVEQALGIELDSYKAIVGRYIGTISKLVIPPNILSIVDMDDICPRHSKESFNLKVLKEKIKARVSSFLIKKELHRFKKFYFLSNQDAKHSNYSALNSLLLPNIPFYSTDISVTANNSKRILFVGALWFQPNREGIEHFLVKCWPSIFKEIKEARFVVVGSVPPDVKDKWNEIEGVEVLGYVADIGQAYHNAQFTISPIYQGGGTNIKVLESFAYGKACITTDFSLRAFGETLRDGRTAIASDSDQMMTANCIRMLNSPQECYSRGLLGQKIVKRHYGKEQFKNTILKSIS